MQIVKVNLSDTTHTGGSQSTWTHRDVDTGEATASLVYDVDELFHIQYDELPACTRRHIAQSFLNRLGV